MSQPPEAAVLSVISVVKTNKMPAGCAINGEFPMNDVQPQMTSEQLEEMWNLKDGSYAPVMAIRQQIDNLCGSNVFHFILNMDKINEDLFANDDKVRPDDKISIIALEAHDALEEAEDGEGSKNPPGVKRG